MNFSPWTGWLVFDEFDILVLSVCAGVYARLAWRALGPGTLPTNRAPGRLLLALLLALGGSGAVALWRGFADSGSFQLDWFAGYDTPLNSLRLFKSLLFALLLLPLLHEEMRDSPVKAGSMLARGMVFGLACVAFATLWERMAYPGLLDFSVVYRVTALFWEMHVGGGAIDAYLAMATPFALGALLSTGRPAVRILLALLIVLAAYACLTTFSRGAYIAVALPTLFLALAWQLRRRRSKRRLLPVPDSAVPRKAWSGPWLAAWLGLSTALMVLAVLGPGTFMANRLGNTGNVLDWRLAHWEESLNLLQSRADWALGLGLGRFPANYTRRSPYGQFSGGVQWHSGGQAADVPQRNFVSLTGPLTDPDLGGLFALTQRVAIEPGAKYELRLNVRARQGVRIAAQVCERHLLYDWYCQGALIDAGVPGGSWQHVTARLSGASFLPSKWYAPRLGMLAIAVLDEGGAVDIGNVGLTASGRKELLANVDFAQGLAHWFPAAQSYFLPWHTDSLYLELLLERGWLGLAIFVALVVFAILQLLTGPARGLYWAPYLLAALAGALLVGVVSSMMDVPRVAFLFYFLVFFSVLYTKPRDIFPFRGGSLVAGRAKTELDGGNGGAWDP